MKDNNNAFLSVGSCINYVSRNSPLLNVLTSETFRPFIPQVQTQSVHLGFLEQQISVSMDDTT